ncbi:LL-diaminopimelate aminotransferase [Absiella sp. AM29-15]|uniref:LL-diaminopimelate aminotransferase n=1 Tax=Absiella sp. AM29-15 TaxID=2292278 RepID=UPI000E4126FA|nr:LL-diaminopimelate aminotransferase [Absiella sp. AM29-15]RGC52015.1 LL-diaminopimelate aminotransferase [Absiella sp. AM29-15]
MNINENFLTLQKNYLFSEVQKRKEAYLKKHPDVDVISLGIGDVTLPLAPVVIEAMHHGVDDMADKKSFHGYGEEQGYLFLRDAIRKYYEKKNVTLDNAEIFISDGAKSDLGNMLDIFSIDNTIIIPDPVYPVYVDTNQMAGRKIIFIHGTKENGFLPMPQEDLNGDIVYLCSPNNPTGAAYNRNQLQAWVDWANDHSAIIFYDAAYEAFLTQAYPSSIYEIEGAKQCAIEFCSLSKTAGFTGVRCGYTIVPLALEKDHVLLHDLWLRRQSTKFNGVSYIVQRGAQAVFTPVGQQQIQEAITYYLENTEMITKTLKDLGIWHTGGKISPYIWMACPKGFTSWEFFDYLLDKCQIVGTPGVGFGKQGEGYFRLSAFQDHDKVYEAMLRMIAHLGF